ncbi:hypothetical protein M378DRAFT_166213 [Amanita muscaria Koide BX008]|uniref:Uncharacterized protein n=1 Tax=Amanita muscaria (strain Koide BX008) TaxID=946122 RepID=A0A0C2SG51_AMAMK|nr:hypothetical protein M378DRAFT_166213 [Amanita muscaria Koide BX008]
MRFSIIYLMSLLLVPALVASKQLDPAHGDIVHYQGHSGPRLGVVVGSPRPPTGNLNIAPLIPGSPHPPSAVQTYSRQVVNAPKGHVVRTGHTARPLASSLEMEHKIISPFSYSTPGPVKGSPNHQAAQANGRNSPGGGTSGRRQA